MSKVLKQACIALALLLIGGMLSMLSMSAASAAPVTASPVVSATKSDDGVKKQASNDDCDTEKTNSGDTEYTYETCAEASGSVKVKAKASGKAKVDSKGRLVLSFIMPGGLPESQQNQCKVIPAGQKYTNNYYDSTGAERWVTKTAPPGGVKICFTGGKWRVVKCGNVVIMKPPPAIKKKIYKGRYVVRNKQRIYSEAVAKATGKSTSHVKAVQAAGPCKGSEATASAVGSFFAIARARAWGWSKSSSLTALQGEIDRLNLQQSVENQAKANAKAQARGKAKTEVDAKIVCNTPPQEPQTPAPNLIETETINDVLVNNTRTIKVTGTVAPNHTATLIASAKNGGSIVANKTMTVQGNFTVQVTYQAPSEVPGANNGVAAGHDQVEFTLTQNDGQSDSIKTNQFVIRQLPPDPL